MGLAVMMTAQSPAMAAEIETSQTENTVVTQEATQEDCFRARFCYGTRNGVGRKCNRRSVY